MRPQPMIAVTDVEASSRWYQRLLGCESAHGGPEYEGGPNHWELWVRDPDGYVVVIASPDGSAGPAL
jgi:catechol 2,3-dioxygenase-like lactoylglutathione lyase family enzyme